MYSGCWRADGHSGLKADPLGCGTFLLGPNLKIVQPEKPGKPSRGLLRSRHERLQVGAIRAKPPLCLTPAYRGPGGGGAENAFPDLTDFYQPKSDVGNPNGRSR